MKIINVYVVVLNDYEGIGCGISLEQAEVLLDEDFDKRYPEEQRFGTVCQLGPGEEEEPEDSKWSYVYIENFEYDEDYGYDRISEELARCTILRKEVEID